MKTESVFTLSFFNLKLILILYKGNWEQKLDLMKI